MAGAIGGNYFANINSQLAAKGPDAAAVDNARQASGDVGSKAHDNKATEHHEGVRFSPKALQTMHKEAIEGHEQELAHQAGVQEETPDNAEQQQIKKERSEAGYQHSLADEEEGFVKVASPNGTEQKLTVAQHQDLERMDDYERNDPYEGIPAANLEAAEKVFGTQAAGGLKQVAKLKPVPEAEKTAEMQDNIAPMHSETMGIAEPGADKTTRPVAVDPPAEMEAVAAEQAALKLQAGEVNEQLIAGAATAGNGKVEVDGAQMAQVRSQRDQAKAYMDTTVSNLIQNYEKLHKGAGQAAQDLISKHENEFHQAMQGQGSTRVSPEMLHYAAIGQAAQDNLDGYAQNNPAIAQLMAKHTHNGMLDLAGYSNEAQTIAKQAAARGDKDTAFWAEDSTYSAALVGASARYLDSQSQLVHTGELPGPLNQIQHGKVDLDQASQSPTHGPSIDNFRNLTPDQAWQAREAGGDALQWAYQRLDPQQQQALGARVQRRVESQFVESHHSKKHEEVDRSMVWADEMEQWSAETISQVPANDPQRTLLDMVHNQAQSYLLLRNVMDERGLG